MEYTDFEVLFHGFEKAFADYEIRFEKNECALCSNGADIIHNYHLPPLIMAKS